MRPIRAQSLCTVLVSFLVMGTCLAGDTVTSGLPVGEPVNEFLVDDVVGFSICYRCRYGDAPVVCVFARRPSDPVARLVKQLDEKVGNPSTGLKGFIVVLPAEPRAKTIADVKKLGQDQGIRSMPLTVAKQPGGPPDYRLAKDADVTVLMWKNGKVRANHAYKGDLTSDDIRTIVDDLPKVLAD